MGKLDGIRSWWTLLWITDRRLDERVHVASDVAARANMQIQPCVHCMAAFGIFDIRTMEEFYDMRVVSTGNTIMEIVAGMGVMGLILAMVVYMA
jgi:hypothetical protein